MQRCLLCRTAKKEFIIGPVQISKGTLVYISFHALHKISAYWNEPNELKSLHVLYHHNALASLTMFSSCVLCAELLRRSVLLVHIKFRKERLSISRFTHFTTILRIGMNLRNLGLTGNILSKREKGGLKNCNPSTQAWFSVWRLWLLIYTRI